MRITSFRLWQLSWAYTAVDPQQVSHAFRRAGTHPPLWIALDQVVDPQNLGAIIRTAAFFRADGIVVCARNRCAQCIRTNRRPMSRTDSVTS